MDPKRLRRSLLICTAIFIITLGNFIRLPGSGEVRPIIIVNLIVLGMIAGVMLMNLILLFRFRKKQ
ncbi:MAG: hypothetical protein NTU44_09820 [Bacteroidetes bacterium]|nr:hypothetical protein [Bacteroidota bacterium]